MMLLVSLLACLFCLRRAVRQEKAGYHHCIRTLPPWQEPVLPFCRTRALPAEQSDCFPAKAADHPVEHLSCPLPPAASPAGKARDVPCPQAGRAAGLCPDYKPRAFGERDKKTHRQEATPDRGGGVQGRHPACAKEKGAGVPKGCLPRYVTVCSVVQGYLVSSAAHMRQSSS